MHASSVISQFAFRRNTRNGEMSGYQFEIYGVNETFALVGRVPNRVCPSHDYLSRPWAIWKGTDHLLLMHRSDSKCFNLWLGCCKLENEILKKAENLEKWPKIIILRPKNVIFERFWPFSKFHFPACSTLPMTLQLFKIDKKIDTWC